MTTGFFSLDQSGKSVYKTNTLLIRTNSVSPQEGRFCLTEQHLYHKLHSSTGNEQMTNCMAGMCGGRVFTLRCFNPTWEKNVLGYTCHAATLSTKQGVRLLYTKLCFHTKIRHEGKKEWSDE